MFEPLLRYLPRYFRRDPLARRAIRLRAPAPAVWEITEDHLTLTWGEQLRHYDLLDHTVGSLVDSLQAEGFVLEQYDQDLLALGATILLEGRKQLSEVGGTDLLGLTAISHCLTRPVERGWGHIRDAIPAAAAQVQLATAESEWLDRHGVLYGVARRAGQDDAAYLQHLIDEVIRPRNDARGIEQTLARWTGYDIRVREPWQEIFTLSASRLSGAHHLQGAPTYQYHTMQLVAQQGGLDWAPLFALAMADRPAGTLMLGAHEILPPWVVPYAATDLVVQVDREDDAALTAAWANNVWDGYWDERLWRAASRETTWLPPYQEAHQDYLTSAGESYATAAGQPYLVILPDPPPS